MVLYIPVYTTRRILLLSDNFFRQGGEEQMTICGNQTVSKINVDWKNQKTLQSMKLKNHLTIFTARM